MATVEGRATAHQLQILPRPNVFLNLDGSLAARDAADWLGSNMPAWLRLVGVVLEQCRCGTTDCATSAARDAAELLVGDLMVMAEACAEAMRGRAVEFHARSDDEFAFERYGVYLAELLETVQDAPDGPVRLAYSLLAEELGERIARMDTGAACQRVRDAAAEYIAAEKRKMEEGDLDADGGLPDGEGAA